MRIGMRGGAQNTTCAPLVKQRFGGAFDELKILP